MKATTTAPGRRAPVRYMLTQDCVYGYHRGCHYSVQQRRPFREWRCACDCHNPKIDRNDPNYGRTA